MHSLRTDCTPHATRAVQVAVVPSVPAGEGGAAEAAPPPAKRVRRALASSPGRGQQGSSSEGKGGGSDGEYRPPKPAAARGKRNAVVISDSESEGEGAATPPARPTGAAKRGRGASETVAPVARPTPPAAARRAPAAIPRRVPGKKATPESFGALGAPGKQKCAATPRRTPSSGRATDGPAGRFTELEKQFIAIKETCPDTLLAVEVGYKYKFIGNDADTAAQELNIMSFPAKNFRNASIPTHRLYVHVRRLVEAGYKVGVVRQTETAALKKAGDGKSSLFTRSLERVYTKSSLIGEELNAEHEAAVGGGTAAGFNYLMCLSESPRGGAGADSAVEVAMVAVSLSTGEIIYDAFDDGVERSAIATRLSHLSPTEILVPDSLGGRSSALLRQACASGLSPPRLEVAPAAAWEAPAEGSRLRRLVEQAANPGAKEGLLRLPTAVQGNLEALLEYLATFGLDRVLELLGSAAPFSPRGGQMLLTAATLRNLELFENQTDRGPRGSLYWVLNHTATAFGARLLRRWMSQPLAKAADVQARLEAVAALAGTAVPAFAPVRAVLKGLPDLERSLTSIFYGKCSPADCHKVLTALARVRVAFEQCAEVAGAGGLNPTLDAMVRAVREGLDGVDGLCAGLDAEAAAAGDKVNLFVNPSAAPEIAAFKARIAGDERALQEHLSEARALLRSANLKFTSVSGEEYLFEVSKKGKEFKLVPRDWTLVSQTKAAVRYRSPEATQLLAELEQDREQLQAAAQAAWEAFLGTLAGQYDELRLAVQQLASADVLLGFAQLAQQPGYCRPVILDEGAHPSSVSIVQGCNPVVMALLDGGAQFVPNDVALSAAAGAERCYIVTGPNMGGKSCLIRSVALIAVMAQVGCFVPAESVELTPLDGVFTRMGAEDNIHAGESTFMHELNEASEILAAATPRSLVIMDELGRGTSTHDGVAIAHSVASHLVERTGCLSLFVTHYLSLASLAEAPSAAVGNFHMAFIEEAEATAEGEDEPPGCTIAFLYKLVRGAAARSYGLNVARLAGMPQPVLRIAAVKSRELEAAVQVRSADASLGALVSAVGGGDADGARRILGALRDRGAAPA